LTRPDCQVVFVDTPGLHKPVTALGERVNGVALDALCEVDVACLVLDGSMPVGSGDRWVASRLDFAKTVVVVNKTDRAGRDRTLRQLSASAEFDALAYFAVSAKTGEGVVELVDFISSRLPEGPQYYPDGVVSDVPEAEWVAELVREQLLAVFRDELPYSIATRVTEWEWPRVRCEIVVERESQKGMVIGKGGSVLKNVGIQVRRQLPEGVFIELHVVVDKDWQSRPDRVERLGY